VRPAGSPAIPNAASSNDVECTTRRRLCLPAPGFLPKGKNARDPLLALLAAAAALATAIRHHDGHEHADAPRIHALRYERSRWTAGWTSRPGPRRRLRTSSAARPRRGEPVSGAPRSGSSSATTAHSGGGLPIASRGRSPPAVGATEDWPPTIWPSCRSYHDHLTTYRFRVNPPASIDDSYIDSGTRTSPGTGLNSTPPSTLWAGPAEMEIPLSSSGTARPGRCVGIQVRRWNRPPEAELAEFSFTPRSSRGRQRYGISRDSGAIHAASRRGPALQPRRRRTIAPVEAGDPFQDGSKRVGCWEPT